MKCFYTEEIEINEENVEALLAAASFLEFPFLSERCFEFLARPGLVNKSNCLGFWALAHSYELKDLTELAFPFVLRHFLEIVQYNDFQRLICVVLKELLENDALQVHSEEDVFNAIIDWVEFDSINRKANFPVLIRCVRLHLLPSTVSPINLCVSSLIF